MCGVSGPGAIEGSGAIEGPGAIEDQARRVRAAGALGRSDQLLRLFDYLVAASARDERPKEVEIALAVFGRDPAFDGAQDASVRVAVHRLRRKLDDFYSGPGRGEPVRLTMPKGEYRLTAEVQPAAPATPAAGGARRRPWLLLGLAALAVGLAGLGLVWRLADAGPVAAVRRLEPWASVVRPDRPLIVVVGDYYIFGEVDPETGTDRLVREYGVNSHEDLEAYRLESPADAGRFRDLDLYYLPVGTAQALSAVTPVLSRDGQGPQVVAASDLTSEMLRRNDVVYLGYLSGLGPLREPLFAGSRFRVGDTWDELVDSRTGGTFVSQEGGPGGGAATQRDFGYLASFPGPQGNRIVVIAGMRDMGLMQAAEAAIRPESLRALRQGRGSAFEALYEAEGVRRANVAGRLVLTAPMEAARIWSGEPSKVRFPAG
jgi:hypothetical protein